MAYHSPPRRSRNRRPRRSRRSRHQYVLNIPSPSQCLRRNYRRSRSYCGSKPRLPLGYSRRGTAYECLRKGFGAGRCSVYRN